MMYIQITTQCNMSCAHCSFSCEIGAPYEEMTWETYCDALSLCEMYGENVNIGGGEPTLHPMFWRMVKEALWLENIESVWLATNGKKTRDAIAMAMLAAEGGLYDYQMWLAENEGIRSPDILDGWDSGEEGYEEAMAEYDIELERLLDEDERTSGTCSEHWERFDCCLSQDQYHAPIDPEVVSAFSLRKHEIRDNTFHLSNIGAAKKNNLYAKDRCSCSAIFIEPSGRVRACGCPDSIVLGDVSDPSGGLYKKLERWFHVTAEAGDCGYFGVRVEDKEKPAEEWEIRQDLIEYVLWGKNYQIFDPNYAEEDVA